MNSDFGLRDFFDSFDNLGRQFIDKTDMKTDIIEHKSDYVVNVELPGFKKDSIKIDYRDDTLNISAVHDVNKQETNDEGQLVRQERNSSSVARSFYLPGINIEKAEAKYDGGILTLTLPKQDPQKDSNHQIQIN